MGIELYCMLAFIGFILGAVFGFFVYHPLIGGALGTVIGIIIGKAIIFFSRPKNDEISSTQDLY